MLCHSRCTHSRISRREVLRVGGLTALGLTLPHWFRLRSATAEPQAAKRPSACILIWLDGGPSHLDTFDLKPDAPQEVRGPFQPIATSVPGTQICECLAETALRMDRVALIRSLTTTLGEHNLGSHYLLTGYKPTPALEYPSYGAVVARTRQASGALPPYVAVPDINTHAGPGYLAGFGPFTVGGDPSKPSFQVRDLDLYGSITSDRLARRQEILGDLDRFSSAIENGPPAGADSAFEQAYRLISSPEAKRAFDLSAEPDSVRNRYGRRTIGQSCLLARRLIEAGVHFVTVTDRGWDTHEALFNRLKEGYTGGSVGKIPSLDVAYSALLDDLAERGLLDSTLVIVMGEFGRTPKLNPAGGRDHWPRAFSVVLAGGGLRGGIVVGQSDARGESPADRPVTPEDLACTIYHTLGIDPRREFHTSDGRPVLVNTGSVIEELV